MICSYKLTSFKIFLKDILEYKNNIITSHVSILKIQ